MARVKGTSQSLTGCLLNVQVRYHTKLEQPLDLYSEGGAKETKRGMYIEAQCTFESRIKIQKFKVQSSFALPFRDGIHIHIHMGVSQSESDFVRYIHIVSLKFAVTNTGHSLCSAHKMQK